MGGPRDASPPVTGTCDNVVCDPGCVCGLVEADAEAFAVCACPDGGTTDAGAVDAEIPDASGDARADGGETACGVIECNFPCACIDPATSACACP
jgi:hypothetical protein